MENTIEREDSGLAFLLRAFRHRNYRLFFSGQIISLTGTWMQTMAVVWLVYRMTNSPFLLGLVGFLGQLPSFLFSAIAGVLADHWPRKKILIVTQTLAMIQAFVLSILSISGHIYVWQIFTLSIMLGIINAFDAPVRQAFVMDMVHNDKKDLSNAIALNSSMFNMARLMGPPLAGILVAAFGEGVCFFLNGLSFFAVLVALLLMRITYAKPHPASKNIIPRLKEGLSYVVKHEPIRNILLMLTLFSLTGTSYMVVVPVMTRHVFLGNAKTLGLLMGAGGLGALIGTLYLAWRKSVAGLEKVIPAAGLVFGASLILFAVSRIFWVSALIILGAGVGMMVQTAASNTAVQLLTDDDKRGRVMSFFTMAFLGVAPFGNLLTGTLTAHIGVTYTLLINGCLCIASTLLFMTKTRALKKSLERSLVP